jgi:MFS family permease
MSDQTASAPPLWRMSSHERLLETAALLNAIAFFAALPFASLYLSDHTSLSKPAIGAVVGGIAFVAAFGGIVGGQFVDRFGAVRVMLVGLAGYVVVYGSLAVARGDVLIVVLLLLLGPPKLLVDPGSKKLLSLASDGSGRVFRRRYMTLCLGGILGPLIGSALYSISPVWFFAVPSIVYAAYALLFLSRRRTLQELERPESQGATRFPLSQAVRDRRLLAAAFAGLVIFIVFSQLESMIPLFMKGLYADQAQRYFAAMFMVNAVLALALQIPIDWVSTKLGHSRLVLLGCVNFALSFFCFWAGEASLAMMFVGIVFWTIGEGVLFPMPDMAVHAIADDRRKATYFGFADTRYSGFFLGPVIGGALLTGSVPAYFVIMALLIFGCAPLLIPQFAAPAEGVPALQPAVAND